MKNENKVAVFVNEIVLEEETSIKRLEYPYKLKVNYSYALINGRYIRKEEILLVSFSSITNEFGSDKEAYLNFIKEYSHKLVLMEANISTMTDRVSIFARKLIDYEKYDEIVMTDRKLINTLENLIKIRDKKLNNILLYENNDLYYGLYMHMNFDKEEPKLYYCYFIKQDINKGVINPTNACIDKHEIDFMNECLKDKKYKGIQNKLIEKFQIQKESNEKEQKKQEKK